MNFQYASADRGSDVTALAGFGIYPDPMRALDLEALSGSAEKALPRRRERRGLALRFRRGGMRRVPSATALRDWLEKFHDPAMGRRVPGKACIPLPTSALRGLWAVNRAMPGFLQGRRPAAMATLDMDAALIETHKRQALYCDKKFRAYRPLNCRWAEQGVMVHS